MIKSCFNPLISAKFLVTVLPVSSDTSCKSIPMVSISAWYLLKYTAFVPCSQHLLIVSAKADIVLPTPRAPKIKVVL